jgi:hypothetical protein
MPFRYELPTLAPPAHSQRWLRAGGRTVSCRSRSGYTPEDSRRGSLGTWSRPNRGCHSGPLFTRVRGRLILGTSPYGVIKVRLTCACTRPGEPLLGGSYSPHSPTALRATNIAHPKWRRVNRRHSLRYLSVRLKISARSGPSGLALAQALAARQLLLA